MSLVRTSIHISIETKVEEFLLNGKWNWLNAFDHTYLINVLQKGEEKKGSSELYIRCLSSYDEILQDQTQNGPNLAIKICKYIVAKIDKHLDKIKKAIDAEDRDYFTII